MDRLEAMSVLITAAECGSLSKAGRQLGMPLATVSRNVAELESHLKATLLIRSSKGLELTPTGRSYVTSAKALLEQLTEVERTAAGEYTEPKGELVVTAPILFGRLHVLPTVTKFLATFPEVSVGLMLTDRVTHFLDDQVDVALRIGALADSSLIATRLGDVRLVTCASPGYLATHGVPATPDDLARHAVVSFDGVSATSKWSFMSGGVETSVSFASRLSVNTIDAAIDAGLAGAGIFRALSYQVVEAVHDGRLKVVLDDFARDARPVHLVYARQGRLPLKLRAFVDFAVPQLRDRLAAAMLEVQPRASAGRRR